MDNEFSRNDKLESILQDGSSEPQSLSLEYLRKITDNFSNDQLLGIGGFGKVYKGVRQNGDCIAVKKLDQLKATVQKPQFENEVYHLMRFKHPNIVRFVGYCYETRNECVFHDGKYVFAEMPQKLVCLEHLTNGSLDRHLSDESSGLGWYTRHKIIRGTCFGLHYLHEECKSQLNASIIHLDLKPANILLDDNMVPKIADFGLPKLFDTGKTQTHTTSPAGSLGYMAPEYIYQHIVSTKADIYSLGAIIIEVITGRKFGPSGIETLFCKDFVEPVLKNWRNRLEATPTCTSPETDCQQIEICLEIGLSCTNFDPEKRPTTTKIIEMLDRCESTNCDEERLAAKQDLQDSNRNALQQYAQAPSDQHIEQMDTGGSTPSNYFEGEERVEGDSQLYPPDGDALPGIEGFEIAVEPPRPGSQLTACGFSKNGTTLCNFQWVRHLENGTWQSIEGATMYDYVVTADDVDTILAVDCTPMDDNGRQGDLVTEFVNKGNKITCDPEMQSRINAFISNGRAEFEVFVLANSSVWELATLVLTRPGYHIKFKKTGEVIIDEKYSQSLQLKIPNGRTTQFALVTVGATLPCNTQGISENEYYDVRLRDLIVLVMRTFQKKDNLGDMTQPRNIYNPNHQQDSGGTNSNYFEGEGRVDGDSQLYQPDGDTLLGIEGFQIAGEPRPGFQLTACGFPTNGTTLGNFQWVRHLENGIRQSIEGATMYDYVVTADDVGTLLAVDCTPMDKNGRKGDLVTEVANHGNKITCDEDMQSCIDACISNGIAVFEVFVLRASSEEWELATLVLRQPNYQIKFKETGEVIIDEEYSQSLQTKIPTGRTTQFVLVTMGATLPFNTQGISEPSNVDHDVRLRDQIVLVVRAFLKKALDA